LKPAVVRNARPSLCINKKPHNRQTVRFLCVVPSRIELESRASETLILSVVLQDQKTAFWKKQGLSVKEGEITNYFNNPLRFVLNILTAIASRITPKNFRMAIIPAGPSMRSIKSMDFRTIKIKRRFKKIPSKTVVVS
jgi:hypothetical protein